MKCPIHQLKMLASSGNLHHAAFPVQETWEKSRTDIINTHVYGLFVNCILLYDLRWIQVTCVSPGSVLHVSTVVMYTNYTLTALLTSAYLLKLSKSCQSLLKNRRQHRHGSRFLEEGVWWHPPPEKLKFQVLGNETSAILSQLVLISQFFTDSSNLVMNFYEF